MDAPAFAGRAGISLGIAEAAPPDGHGPRTSALPFAAQRALGGLLPLLDEAEVRDVLVQVQGGSGRLWIDRAGALEQVTGWSVPPEAVRRLAVALIAASGRHIDELNPCADVHLGGGVRVHAVLPPVAAGGAAVSIRLPSIAVRSFAELVRSGLCDAATAERLRRDVRGRRNILITGGTGSGKTTLLGALLDLVDGRERILTIEDLAELRLRHPHVVSLEARQASAEGVGAVGVARLLTEALRMRPDRIVLGECRGAEIATLLTALNTGHDGGAGTLHASRIADVPARLEALGALAGLGPQALARQAVSALHTIVHLERRDGRHRVAGLGVLRLGRDGSLEIGAVSV